MTGIKQLIAAIYSATGLAVLFKPGAMLAASACTGAEAVGATCNRAGLEGALANILNAVFFLVGALAVIALLYGAVKYITSTGDAARVKAAKDTIIYAIAGLVVAILAPAIVGFVIGSIF